MKIFKQCFSLLLMAALIALVAPSAAADNAAADNAAAVDATAMKSSVLLDGRNVTFDAYFIGGSSYFKLRDLAFALFGTPRQFDITYEAPTRQIHLAPGIPYSPIGGEMGSSGTPIHTTAIQTSSALYLHGKKLTVSMYLIGSNNYIRLRDIAAAVDFRVGYLPATGNVVIDTSAGYGASFGVSLSELNVTMIGDSIGISLEPYLKKHLPRLDNHSKVSRQFYQAESVVRELLEANSLAPTVIIELGTNGTIDESDMRALIELIGCNRKIVFINCQIPRSWGTSDNMTIAAVTADYTNTVIADWYSASLDQDGYLYSDNVHPTGTGATVMAQVVADAVQKVQ